MWTARDVFDLVRARLVVLIDLEKRACGSTVTAMKTVARRIGASHAWVKRIVGRYDGASIHAHLHLNIEHEHRVRIGAGLKNGAARVVRVFKRRIPPRAVPVPVRVHVEN